MENVSGVITEIQRYSVHDGPGIRTTAFLKGCSLNCFWCHNPEAVRSRPEIQFLPEKCMACGACVLACPERAHVIEAGLHVYWRGRCRVCGACSRECCTLALELIGVQMTAVQAVQELLRDTPFYQDSGGGITLSGGEPLMQPGFARAVLTGCKDAGIHTAIETAGNYPWRFLEPLLPYIDLVMMDIKHMDTHKHRAGTGAPNERILSNARRLTETDKPLLFRVPVVPGFNDTSEKISEIAAFVRQLATHRETNEKRDSAAASVRLELIRFHPLAADKYRALGLENRTESYASPSKEAMNAFIRVARESGLDVLG